MTDEKIPVLCPNFRCKHAFAVSAALRGKTVKCPSCSMLARVPVQKPQMPHPVEERLPRRLQVEIVDSLGVHAADSILFAVRLLRPNPPRRLYLR